MLRFKHFLMIERFLMNESKIDDYKAQERNISTEHDPDAQHKSAADIIDHFHKHTPGGNVQHTRWMMDQYKKGEIKQEDAHDMHDTVKNFEKYKSKLPKKRIEQYKSVSELKTAMHPHKEKDEEVKAINNSKVVNGSTVVHNSPNLTAYHVHTTEAAQELGKKDNGEKLGWCTSIADRSKNMFQHYNEKSRGNFHILHMHKEQFPHRRIGGVGVNGQFQDENNKTIKGEDFHNLIHRNPELEKIPAIKNSRHYKVQKASDPTNSKEHLDKLINDKDEDIRAGVAANKSATKEHLDKLIEDESEHVRNTVFKNSPHKEHIDKYAITHKDPKIRASVATNPNATKEHLDKLSNDENEDVRTAVAENTSHKKYLDKLVNDKDHKVRAAVANNPNATKEHFDKLVNDKSEHVRKAVLVNSPHKEHIDKLNSDESPNIRANIVHTNKNDNEKLGKFINDPDDFVRLNVARNTTQKDHLDHLAGDKSSNVRLAVAKNKAADKDHFNKLINDKEGMVKIAAADNTPHKEHLDKLIKDKSPYVREAAAKNPNATKEHLNILANDKHKDVSMAAKQELTRRP